MVNKHGQSMVEFMLILAVLTFIGLVIASVMHPGPGGAVSTVQDNATNKIAND